LITSSFFGTCAKSSARGSRLLWKSILAQYLCRRGVGATIVFLLGGPLRFVRLILVLLAVALLVPSQAAPAEPQVDSQYGPLPVFELHSGFWINLHHTLYGQARQSRDGRGSPSGTGATTHRTPSEQIAWDAAVSYYAANYQDKDLLFNTELILLKNQLGDFEQCDELSGAKKKTCDAGLPPKLTRILDAAAPVYRAHEWPEHDRANRRLSLIHI